MIDASFERPRPAEGAGFGDAVTFAFGAPRHGLFGSARLGLVPGEPAHASSIALLFHGGSVASVSSDAVELVAPDWARVAAGDVTAEIIEPLRSWSVTYDGDGGRFDLRFEALGAPAEVGRGALAASAAALHGYEQLCRVRGTVGVGSDSWDVDCLGQRGHQWGAPDWQRIELSRTLGVWLEGEQGVALASVRPRGAAGQEDEAIGAFLLGDEPVAVEDPRLSTTLDGGGRQLRAGLELWVDEESGPLRAAGDAVCGTTFDLGELRLDCAFFEWRMDGQRGVGRYDVLRRR